MTIRVLPYIFNICYRIDLKLPENWYAKRNYDDLNYLNISARVTTPVYYFTTVLYEKTAVKCVKLNKLKTYFHYCVKVVLNHNYVKL